MGFSSFTDPFPALRPGICKQPLTPCQRLECQRLDRFSAFKVKRIANPEFHVNIKLPSFFFNW
jgi:hypothetical protein